MSKYSIGQVAVLTGVNTKTIRFYEEDGLIGIAKRSENGYRYYVDKDVDEIRLVKNARDLGLPILEIKRLVKGCSNGDCEHSKEYIQKTIDSYLKILNERVRQMKILKTRLTKLQKTGPYCCGLLHQLTINNEKEVR